MIIFHGNAISSFFAAGIMNHYFIILVVAGVAGCLIGLLFRSVLISRLPALVQRMMSNIHSDLFDADNLHNVLSANSNFDNIRPLVEGHIDEFLSHRLGKEMPMIGMFIGEKTIAQLKAIFMKELEEIFPLVMDKYIIDFAPQVLLSNQAETFSKLKLASLLHKYARREMMLIPIFATIAGLTIGILQLIVILVAP